MYARFIPREELSSFAAWSPGSLSGEEEAAAAAAEPQLSPEEQQAEALRAARQGGYHDGYRDGLAALESFKQSFAQQATAQMGALMQSYAAQMDELQQQMAGALADAAVSLARQVVRGELQANAQQVATVAQEAIEALLLPQLGPMTRIVVRDGARRNHDLTGLIGWLAAEVVEAEERPAFIAKARAFVPASPATAKPSPSGPLPVLGTTPMKTELVEQALLHQLRRRLTPARLGVGAQLPGIGVSQAVEHGGAAFGEAGGLYVGQGQRRQRCTAVGGHWRHGTRAEVVVHGARWRGGQDRASCHKKCNKYDRSH